MPLCLILTDKGTAGIVVRRTTKGAWVYFWDIDRTFWWPVQRLTFIQYTDSGGAA